MWEKMIPTVKVSGGIFDGLLFYGGVLGLLLLVGTLLRLKIGFFKKYYIPASLIAGALGIIIGPHCLKVIPPEMSSAWSGMPGRLITIVFAPMLMGVAIQNPRKYLDIAAPSWFFGWIGAMIQIGIPFLITGLILMPLWGVNPMFGTIVEVGFSGGHGTAGGMIEVYNGMGWADGGSLGMMSATVGLIVGIVAGMIIINYSIRKGYTSVVKSTEELKSAAEDIIPERERGASSISTINHDIIDGFALHAAFIGLAILLGWFMQKFVGQYIKGFPLFPMAMIGGFIIQCVISKTRWANILDKGTFARIQGLAMEFLIVSAVATIQIPVIIAYAGPLLILMSVSTALMVWYFFSIGPRMFHEDWVEHAIVQFGTLTAVAAIGLMLLRTIDPDMKTNANLGYALRAPFSSPFIGGGLVTSSLPVFAVTFGPTTAGLIALGVCAALFLACYLCGWLHKPSYGKTALKP